MLKKLKIALGAALVAASQLAMADVAEVKISNLKFEAFNGEWWADVPTWNTWAPPSGTTAHLDTPVFHHSTSGRQGEALTSTVTDGTSQAQATLTQGNGAWWDASVLTLNNVTALASVNAVNGQSGWAYANVFGGPVNGGGGQIQVGGNATVRVSLTIDSLKVIGDMAQAGVSIQFCTWDTNVCDAASYAEALVDSSWPTYTGPSVLTASWTNPGPTTWARLHIGLNASAESVTAVPEPSTYALWLAGLGAVGAITRRRRRD
jgi:hypothetical protein